MKRSEVIRLIEDIIDDMISRERPFYEIACTILAKQEDAGMLPPYNPIGSDRLERYINLCSWEDEDDTQ